MCVCVCVCVHLQACVYVCTLILIIHYTKITVVRVCVRTGVHRKRADPELSFAVCLAAGEATKMGSMWAPAMVLATGTNVSLANELFKTWATLKTHLDLATDSETAGFTSSC